MGERRKLPEPHSAEGYLASIGGIVVPLIALMSIGILAWWVFS